MNQNQDNGMVQRYLPAASNLPPLLFGIMVLIALVMGWRLNLSNYISPETGIGYLLGIIGGSMMLLMLLYSLRKRLRFMRHFFAVKYWFRMHMMFGVLGPTCILYHCAFSLGSVNSNVALVCMLIVAGSGLIGRYIYRQIHYGLYGNKTNAEQLKQDLLQSLANVETLYTLVPDIEQKLFHIDISKLQQRQNIFTQFVSMLFYRIKSRIAVFQAFRTISKTRSILKKQQHWDNKTARRFSVESRRALTIYYATIRKIVGLQFYERMFALWHVLHVPLFIMMIISGIAHVFAVHLY